MRLGIEPSTNHVLGHKAARERGELIWLEHGESARIPEHVSASSTARQAIAAAEKRIRALAAQPEDEYPEPSGNHLPIGGRS